MEFDTVMMPFVVLLAGCFASSVVFIYESMRYTLEGLRVQCRTDHTLRPHSVNS